MLNEEFYTIKEISKLLKVAYLTVYRWVQEGKIIAFKVGKQYRIRKIDLENFIISFKK